MLLILDLLKILLLQVQAVLAISLRDHHINRYFCVVDDCLLVLYMLFSSNHLNVK